MLGKQLPHGRMDPEGGCDSLPSPLWTTLVLPLLQVLHIITLSTSPAMPWFSFYVCWKAALSPGVVSLVPNGLNFWALCPLIESCLFSEGGSHAQSELFISIWHDLNLAVTICDPSSPNQALRAPNIASSFRHSHIHNLQMSLGCPSFSCTGFSPLGLSLQDTLAIGLYPGPTCSCQLFGPNIFLSQGLRLYPPQLQPVLASLFSSLSF